MYKELELFAAARAKGFSVQVQGDVAVVYGSHPARISHEMAAVGFTYSGHETGVIALTGATMMGVVYPVKP